MVAEKCTHTLYSHSFKNLSKVHWLSDYRICI